MSAFSEQVFQCFLRVLPRPLHILEVTGPRRVTVGVLRSRTFKERICIPHNEFSASVGRLSSASRSLPRNRAGPTVSRTALEECTGNARWSRGISQNRRTLLSSVSPPSSRARRAGNPFLQLFFQLRTGFICLDGRGGWPASSGALSPHRIGFPRPLSGTAFSVGSPPKSQRAHVSSTQVPDVSPV